jgi:ABC-2 type transport system permease protein
VGEVLRAGLSRGVVELRHSLPLVLNYVFFPSVAVAVMFAVRGVDLGDEGGTSLALYALPGVLAMNVVFTGLMGLATTLMTEREDGTLLRARSVPHGIHGYLLGKVVSQTLLVLLTMAVVLAQVFLLFDGFAPSWPADAVTLAWLVPLGVVATLPLGAVAGSVLPHPRHLSLLSLTLMVLVGLSGVFYPLVDQPGWLVAVAHLSPLYWMGVGLRSALLPDAYQAFEVGGTWPLVEVAAALGAWGLLGLLAAVPVMRRAARRQAGSRGPRRPRPLSRRSRPDRRAPAGAPAPPPGSGPAAAASAARGRRASSPSPPR